MLVVGLTGGIACGKTTVSKRLDAEHHLAIVDADKIAREVLEPGSRGYDKVKAHFNGSVPDLIDQDGNLNRRLLGGYVFSHPEELKILNSIVHPAVRWEMAREVWNLYIGGSKIVILDVPLLFESKLDIFCGTTVLVTCSDEVQLNRLLKRDPDLSLEDAKNRIRNQMSNEAKLLKLDIIINNDKSIADLEAQVDSMVMKITPNWFWNMFLLVLPPVALAVAGWTFALNKFRASSKPKQD